ncbi:hypothetical protein OROGR_018618 [Orobanche gracilis]
MSSCLSGGGKLNLELIKFPTSSWTSWTSNSSSSSSSSSSQHSTTLSESNNSVISTRKNRTPRKRPNQTYIEAASILSTAYPKLFPTKHLTKTCRFTKPLDVNSPFPFEPSDLLDNPGCLLPIPKSLNLFEKACRSPIEINSSEKVIRVEHEEKEEEEGFDAKSILDKEIEDGIDSIMGKLSMGSEKTENDSNNVRLSDTCCYGYPVGLGFGLGYGIRSELRAMRNDDRGDDWWRFPVVDLSDLTRKSGNIPVVGEKKKKNKKKQSKENLTSSVKETFCQTPGGLLLNLDYDDVLRAWSDKGSPFYGDGTAAESSGPDAQVCALIPRKRNRR